MKIVPKDEHIIEVRYDLTKDISDYLIGYLSQFNLNFFFGEQNLYLNEVFMIEGGLSLFLFDNEKAIKEYCNDKTNTAGQPLNIEIIFNQKEKDSYFGFYPKIQHNLLVYNGYKFDNHIYYDFIHFLCKHILNKQELKVKDNKIMLDNLYSKMVYSINHHPNENKPVNIEAKIENVIKEDKKITSFKFLKKTKKSARKTNKE